MPHLQFCSIFGSRLFYSAKKLARKTNQNNNWASYSFLYSRTPTPQLDIFTKSTSLSVWCIFKHLIFPCWNFTDAKTSKFSIDFVISIRLCKRLSYFQPFYNHSTFAPRGTDHLVLDQTARSPQGSPKFNFFQDRKISKNHMLNLCPLFLFIFKIFWINFCITSGIRPPRGFGRFFFFCGGNMQVRPILAYVLNASFENIKEFTHCIRIFLPRNFRYNFNTQCLTIFFLDWCVSKWILKKMLLRNYVFVALR